MAYDTIKFFVFFSYALVDRVNCLPHPIAAHEGDWGSSELFTCSKIACTILITQKELIENSKQFQLNNPITFGDLF